MMVDQVVSSLQNDHQQQIVAAVEKARSEEKVDRVGILSFTHTLSLGGS